MGDNRPVVYREGDNLIIRASGIGHPCLWELIAAGQEEPMGPLPNVLVRAFSEGNLLEPVIIKRLEREYGVVFESHQSEGELWLSGNIAIRYHSDGIGEQENDWHVTTKYVVEVKALSDALWQIAKRGTVGDVMDEYNWQLSVMMWDTQLPGLWVAYNKGLPPDENGERPPCPDMGKMLIQPITEPPVSMEEIQLKASLIEVGVYGEPILSSDRECDTPNHWPCRYLHVRPEPEGTHNARAVYIPEDTQLPDVDRLVAEFLYHKGQMAENKQRYEEARNRLIELAGEEVGYIQTDRWWVPISTGTSVSVDQRSMSPEFRKAYEKFKRRKSYRYIHDVRRLD